MKIELDTLCRQLREGKAQSVSLALELNSFEDFHAVEESLGKTFERLTIGSLFNASDDFLPSPSVLFNRFQEYRVEVAKQGRHLIVLGLDAYLALLGSPSQEDCLRLVARSLRSDDGIKATTFIFRRKWSRLAADSRHPFVYSRILSVLGYGQVNMQDFAQARFLLFPDTSRFVKIAQCTPLIQWLNAMANWESLAPSPIRLRFPFTRLNPLSGFSPSRVLQCLSASSALAALQGIPLASSLSETAAQWVFDKGLAEMHPLEQAILKQFHYEGNPLNTFKECQTEAERTCLLWALGQIAKPNSYLATILDEKPCTTDAETFIRRYIEVPRAILMKPLTETQPMARERANVIKGFGVTQPLVSYAQRDFFVSVRDVPIRQLVQWLGFQTKDEDVEWLRRTMSGEFNAFEQSELLCDYSEAFPQTIPKEIRDYLDAYRVAKRTNKISEDFIAHACDNSALEVLNNQKTRSAQLAEWRDDSSSLLLIIDALGAEYLPFLCRRLKVAGFSVMRSEIARCNLPTDTARNNLNEEEWSSKDRCRKINDLDEALHNTPSPDVGSIARAIVDNLYLIEERVIKNVREVLDKGFSRVIVTSDHGATRLATLAWQTHQELVHTVSTEEMVAAGLNSASWRMANCNKDAKDSNLWSFSSDRVFASIRGYNRFSQPGSIGFESHGGATLEERAVPILVVTQGTSADEVSVEHRPTHVKQIEEDSDFDI